MDFPLAATESYCSPQKKETTEKMLDFGLALMAFRSTDNVQCTHMAVLEKNEITRARLSITDMVINLN